MRTLRPVVDRAVWVPDGLASRLTLGGVSLGFGNELLETLQLPAICQPIDHLVHQLSVFRVAAVHEGLTTLVFFLAPAACTNCVSH